VLTPVPYGSITVVKITTSCAKAEAAKWGLAKGKDRSCYSENTQGFGSVSVAAKPNCPANVFLKRWIASDNRSKSIV